MPPSDREGTGDSTVENGRRAEALRAHRSPVAAAGLAEALEKAKVAAALFDETSTAPKVGRFTLLDRVGAGAMGEVFAAYDDQLDRKVAIKLVRADATSSEADERLLREARAVAKLSHPNVVQVYDVGTIGDRVFIAMEFLEGESLHEWAKAALPWRDKLAVLDRAARGLAAAHAAGLMHRDIKPSNIMVGSGERVSVIDFGLASVDTDAVGGTLAYMAPEQAAGRASMRSDQFSLCVTAFEVLYGQRPFRDDALPSLRHQQAAPGLPSGVDVPGWVGHAILRGLAMDPEARFDNIEALRSAWRRDPVRRRRRVFGALALAAAGLAAGGAIAVGVQTIAADPCAASDTALAPIWSDQVRRRVGAQIRATALPYAADVWDEAAPALDGYAQRWTAAHRAACEATHVLRTQSEASLDRRIACLDRRRRSFQATVGVFEAQPQAAAGRHNQLLARLPDIALCEDVQMLASGLPMPPSAAAAAQAAEARAHLSVATARLTVADFAGAAEALSAAEGALSDVDDGPARGEVAHAKGLFELARSNWPAGVALLERAAQEAIVHRHDELALEAWLALVTEVGHSPSRIDVAQAWLRQAEAYRRRLGPDRRRAALRLDIGRARVAYAAGRYEAALETLDRALVDLDPDDPVGWELRLTRAGVYLVLGRFDRARSEYDVLLRLYSRRWGPEHPKAGAVHLALGQLYAQHLGALAKAEHHLARALTTLSAAFGPGSLDVAAVHAALSVLALYRGDYSEALVQARRAHAVEAEKLGPMHPRTSASLANIGTYSHLLGQYQAAATAFRASLEALETRLGPDNEDVATAASNLGESLLALGRSQQARPYFERAIRILEAQRGPKHFGLAYPLKGLGLVMLAEGRPQAAVALLERALNLTPAETGDPQERAEISWGLARALRQSGGSRGRSNALARDARALYEGLGSVWGPRIAEIARWLAP